MHLKRKEGTQFSEKGVIIVVRKAETLSSLRELAISGRTRGYLSRRYDSLQDVVLAGRRLFHYYETTGLKPTMKWQEELPQALDAAGFIRHDIDARSFGVSRLYKNFYPNEKDQFGPVCYADFNNISYETYKGFNAEQIDIIKNYLDNNLGPEKAEVIKLRFGLVDGKMWHLEDVGEKIGRTRDRVRQLETSAIRHLRSLRAANGFPRFLESPENGKRVDELVAELDDIRNELVQKKVRVGEIKNELSGIARLPFTCSIKAAYCLVGEDDKSIDELLLSARTYNALKRAEIMTVGEIIRYQKHDWRKLRGFGQKSAQELETKLRAMGYTDFCICRWIF